MKKHEDRRKEELINPEFEQYYNIEKMKVDLACKIVSLRKANKLTQSELAEHIGITQQQLSRFENGGNVTIDLLLRICKSLNCYLKLETIKSV
ncbi:MAG: helix-turn-helix transcriptional regulator [candidate division WOR-3 bacterium]|nr:helix-turn-helix transcriptional regulator [candidate division WOR-3 bacterium]